jgi:plastocyanin
MLAAAGASATPANVTVGPNNSLSFSPNEVTINAGETVTFTSPGGFMPHNVAATDGSFRCAMGCDDSGGNGTPTSQAFTFTRTFNTPGTINYLCQYHGAIMSGKIIVNPAVAPPPQGQNVVSGLSGNWDDPDANQGGHGFQLEVLANNGMLAIWFVFNPTGTQQTWIYSQGTYDPNSNDVVLPAFLETGGTFPPNFDQSKLTTTPFGNLEFKFTDCTHGTAQFTPNEAADSAGYHIIAPFPIQKLTHIVGTTCP